MHQRLHGTYFPRQYALQNTGQSFTNTAGTIVVAAGKADADVDAVEAWTVTTGNEVRVAVLDSGVASDNADIAPKAVARANFSAYSVVGRRMYRRQYSTLFPGRAVPETL